MLMVFALNGFYVVARLRDECFAAALGSAKPKLASWYATASIAAILLIGIAMFVEVANR